MGATPKSKMEKVGKLYGMMPFYKRFYLKDKNNNTIVSHNGEPIEYIFTEEGLREKNNTGTDILTTFNKILTEEFVVIDIPFIPEVDELYYYVSAIGVIDSTKYKCDAMDAALIAFGNCFRTYEEAMRYQNEIYTNMLRIFARKEPMRLLERRKELV